MKINEIARLTGITVRTLHYYDEIGLLKPSCITDAGYRIYDDTSLATLQQILFFKELDFPLNDIKDIMQSENYDKTEALNKHKIMLMQKRERLDALIVLVENTMKGDKNMSFKEFDMTEIEENKKKYADEVKQRWGNTDPYAQSEKKTSTYDEKKWKAVSDTGSAILADFGKARHMPPDSEDAQKLVQRWQTHISDSFYTCTDEILSGLGSMYVNDERFMRNIDENGEGTAVFMAKAIEIYCSK